MLHVPLRFTFGATPADLFVASMAAQLISSTYLHAGIGRAQNWDPYRATLPTELCLLG